MPHSDEIFEKAQKIPRAEIFGREGDGFSKGYA